MLLCSIILVPIISYHSQHIIAYHIIWQHNILCHTVLYCKYHIPYSKTYLLLYPLLYYCIMYALYIFYRILIQFDNRRYPLKSCFLNAIIQELRTVNAFSRIKLCFITGGLALGNQICMLEYIKMGWSIAGTLREMGGIGYWNFWEFPGWRMRVSQYGCKSYVRLVGLVTQFREPLSVNKKYDVRWSFGPTLLYLLLVSDLSSPHSYMKSEDMKDIRVAYRRKKSVLAWCMVRKMLTEQTEALAAQGPNSDSKVSAWKSGTPHVYRQRKVWLNETYLFHHTLCRTLHLLDKSTFNSYQGHVSYKSSKLQLTNPVIFFGFIHIHRSFPLFWSRLPHEVVPSSPVRPRGWSDVHHLGCLCITLLENERKSLKKGTIFEGKNHLPNIHFPGDMLVFRNYVY